MLAVVPSSAAFAACGVGTTIWEGDNSTSGKLFAFTTDFWTFKVISTTFEVAGCDAGDNLFKASVDPEVRQYASQNLDHLAIDMARGRGDHVEVLVRLIGMSDAHGMTFRALAQRNFQALFPYDHVTSTEMLGALKRMLIDSSELSQYVAS